MIAKLIFKLPGDRYEYETAFRAADWRNTVYDIVNELREKTKYTEAPKELHTLYDWVWELLSERGLDPFLE